MALADAPAAALPARAALSRLEVTSGPCTTAAPCQCSAAARPCGSPFRASAPGQHLANAAHNQQGPGSACKAPCSGAVPDGTCSRCPLLADSPMCQGLLTGKYSKDNRPSGPRAQLFTESRYQSVQVLPAAPARFPFCKRSVRAARLAGLPRQTASTWDQGLLRGQRARVPASAACGCGLVWHCASLARKSPEPAELAASVSVCTLPGAAGAAGLHACGGAGAGRQDAFAGAPRCFQAAAPAHPRGCTPAPACTAPSRLRDRSWPRFPGRSPSTGRCARARCPSLAQSVQSRRAPAPRAANACSAA